MTSREKGGFAYFQGSYLRFSQESLVYGVKRVGEDVLLHLLTGTSIFIPLPNGCLCQVTGEHIFNLTQISLTPSPPSIAPVKRKADGEGQEAPQPSKQRKLDVSGKSKKKYVPRFYYPPLSLILLQTKPR